MTDEEYFGELKLMFATPGWKLFIEEQKTLLEEIDTLSGLANERDLAFRQGQLNVLNNLIMAEDTLISLEEMETPEEPDEETRH